MPEQVLPWPENEIAHYQQEFDELFEMWLEEESPSQKEIISFEMDKIQKRIDWLESL